MSLSPQVCKKSYKVKIPTLGENCEFWLITVTDESGITNPNKDHAYLTDSGKLYIYNGKTLIQVNCDICFTQEERDKLEGIEEGANKYVLPVATDNALGGIKTGFTQTEKQYAVEVTEEGQAYVIVPWTDTVYTLPVADTDTLGGVKLGYSQNGKNYPVVKDSEGNIYVAVPWEEYSLPQAETNTLGGIKTGYEQQGKNYPVLVGVDGNAYVTVPWTDTDTKYNVVSTTENGLAPMLPTENEDKKFLNGEGEWVEVNESINGNTVTGSTFSGETSDCGVQILEVQGKTVQQTTNGYQLFDASKLATKSQGGATVTNNGDGSFTISGSGNLTEKYVAYYRVSNEDIVKLLKVGTLKLLNNDTVPNLVINFVVNRIEGSGIGEPNNSFEITQDMLNDPTFEMVVYMFGQQGSQIKTGTIKPMLYQDGDGTWEPYTGGKPAPNPDYPMEIENVEISKIISHGRQLFDASKLPTKSQGGATLTNNGDGSFTLTGSGNLSEGFNAYYYVGNADFLKKGLLKLNLNGSMSLLLQIIGLSVKGNQAMENRTFTITNNGTVEITDELLRSTVDVMVTFYGSNGSSITSGTVKPMLYQDGDGTWEPFHMDNVETSLTLAEGDTYENGQITRTRKQVVFDGSSDESWLTLINNRFQINIAGVKNNGYHTPKGICDRLKPVALMGMTTISEWGIIACHNNSIYLRISESVTTVEQLRVWLSTHPLTVEYELETPTTEEFKVPTIPSYEPYTEISTNSVVDPTITFRPLPFTTCLVGEATEEESGYMPKLSGNESQFLNGMGQWQTTLTKLPSIGQEIDTGLKWGDGRPIYLGYCQRDDPKGEDNIATYSIRLTSEDVDFIWLNNDLSYAIATREGEDHVYCYPLNYVEINDLENYIGKIQFSISTYLSNNFAQIIFYNDSTHGNKAIVNRITYNIRLTSNLLT